MEDNEFLSKTCFVTQDGSVIYSKYKQIINEKSFSFEHIGYVTEDEAPYIFAAPISIVDQEKGILYFTNGDDNDSIKTAEKPKKIIVPKHYRKLYKQLRRLKKSAESSGSEYCQEYDNDSAADYEFGKASAFQEVIDLITIEDEQR